MAQTLKKPRPGIKDVADRLDVSIMTVSRALRGVEGVSQNTRKRVLQVAEELGYKPNYNARSLAGARSRLIGVSIPTLFDEVFAEILTVARTALERSGFDLIIETSSYDLESESVWVDRVLKWAPAGLIVTGVDHSPAAVERLRDADIPIVEIWDYTNTPIDVCVGLDHEEAGRLAAQHLLDAGYRNACLVGILEDRDPRAEKRFASFARHFGAAGGVAVHRVDMQPSFEAGQAAVLKMEPAVRDGFDCFFFLNDHLAFGGLCALQALGVSVPDDVGVMGFNDLCINAVLPRPITTIATERDAMGNLAANRMLSRINGARTPAATQVPVKIKLGATTVKARGG
ncbi:MAG: LacI family DNA-binding transcriptional regulator [Pseudomonadota bacterium]